MKMILLTLMMNWRKAFCYIFCINISWSIVINMCANKEYKRVYLYNNHPKRFERYGLNICQVFKIFIRKHDFHFSLANSYSKLVINSRRTRKLHVMNGQEKYCQFLAQELTENFSIIFSNTKSLVYLKIWNNMLFQVIKICVYKKK